MTRWWILALAGVLAWHGLGSTTAFAQFGYTQPQPQGGPTFSPYLNLNRSGTQAGINYFGLVRPQLQTNQQLQNLQNQQALLANELGGGAIVPGQPVPVSTTGHPVYYFDYARYFPLQGLSNGGGAGGGGYGGGPRGGAPLGAAQPPAAGIGIGVFAR